MEQRSPDQLVEWAYDQFLEQAADMLAPEQIVDITLEFEQRGAVEATLAHAAWSTEVGVPVRMERWAGVWGGLLPGVQSDPEVHVRWHPQQQA